MEFVIFSNVGWREMDGAFPPTQYARELLARGHRVLFVVPVDEPDPPRNENLRVVGPRALGLSEQEGARAWYGRPYGPLDAWRAGFRQALDEFERPAAERRVAVWTYPFAPLVELAALLKSRDYYLVYLSLDDLAELDRSGYYFYFPGVEDYLVTQCDLVVVITRMQQEKFRARREQVALIRNGITLSDFAHVPPRTADPAALQLGFWGSITHVMLDVDLIEFVARARPRWQIDLIGAADADPLAPPVAPRLRALSNVRLLGPQPHAALARRLANFDVGLVPSPVDRFNLGRDPIKVYEYLAGYRPVVATNLSQLEGLPYVYLARDHADFVERVEEASATPVDHARLDRFLAEQTWACRADALLDRIAQTPPRKAIAPFAPPPAHDSPEALRAYIAHLEQLVETRTAHVRRLEEALAGAGLRGTLGRWGRKLRS